MSTALSNPLFINLSRDRRNHVHKIALKMEEKGSFLLGALGKSFKDVLRGTLDSEQVE